MLNYLFAFLLYAFILSILTAIALLYTKFKKKMTLLLLNKRINEFRIFSYINSFDKLYQQVINSESKLSSNEKKTVKVLFDDVYQLKKTVDYDNIEGFVERVRIQKGKKTVVDLDSSITDNNDLVLELIKRKTQLVLMIICHNLEIYNVEEILCDPAKEAAKAEKKLNLLIHFTEKMPISNKRKKRSYESFEKDVTRDITCTNTISKPTRLAVA